VNVVAELEKASILGVLTIVLNSGHAFNEKKSSKETRRKFVISISAPYI
jgi:hypothetical protein